MKATKAELVVLGAGPGGYTAAFYAAARGKKVVMVEMEDRLGGVCLNRGCIPSKALLHAAKLISEAEESSFRGISFAKPTLDLDKMRAWKDSIVQRLAKGVSDLAQRRGVEVLYGRGYFEDSKTLRVETSKGQQFLTFDKAIIATGSRAAMPAAFDLGNKRIMTSTEALEMEEIPKKLLIVGGGYIGMELGTVYATMGSGVVVVEALGSILTGADPDLVRPIMKYAEKAFKEVRTNVKVLKMATSGKQIKVSIECNGEKTEELYDRVLVSVGRAPNTTNLGLENTKVQLDEKGFIKVSHEQQTADPNLFAIGDVAGGVLLAHKAAKEAHVAVEVITGEKSVFENIIIPAVVFTDPELAWCGLTEAEARANGKEVQVVKYPWSASGRALSFDRTDGMTKLVVDPETERLLGVGIVGAGAGELISEAVVAIEMGATAKDLAESVHPHPTLSETIFEAAEMYYGYATHMYSKKRS
ncbi:dihydrolipoyl dehydrogenase [bacterium]|nr:MAG: dihydrolipoyl dehydrogenase [bacterium]